jgi:hypothetical protein
MCCLKQDFEGVENLQLRILERPFWFQACKRQKSKRIGKEYKIFYYKGG